VLAAGPLLLLAALGVYEPRPAGSLVLRNYPIAGHLRFLLEEIPPGDPAYFIERNTDGVPFDRRPARWFTSGPGHRGGGAVRHRARGVRDRLRTLCAHMCPLPTPEQPPRVRIGGPDCRQPYDMALAERLGDVVRVAVVQRDPGAQRRRGQGGFAHDTGEGGLSEYHLRPGATWCGRSAPVTSAAAPRMGASTRPSSPRGGPPGGALRVAETVPGRQARSGRRAAGAKVTARSPRARVPEARR